MEDGEFIIHGVHKSEADVSEKLKKRLLENGMPNDVFERIIKGGGRVC